MSFLSRASLQTKFAGLIFGIILLIVATSGSYFVQSTYSNLIEQTNARVLASREVSAATLQLSFATLESDLALLSHEPVLVEFLSGRNTGVDANTAIRLKANLEAKLLVFATAQRTYLEIGLIDRNGSDGVRVSVLADNNFVTAPDTELKADTDYPYFETAFNLPSDQVFTSLSKSDHLSGNIADTDLLLHYAAPVTIHGVHSGVMYFILPAEDFFKYLSQGSAHSFLVDAQGNYSYIPAAVAAEGDLDTSLPLAVSFSELSASLAAQDMDRLQSNGYIFAHTSVPIAGQNPQRWRVVSYTSVAEAVAPLTTTLLPGQLIFLGILVVSILIATITIRWLTSPLRELTQAADRVAAGDFNVDVRADSSTDLSRLARAFNSMAANLRTTIASLETQVARRTERLEVLNRELNDEIAERQRVQEALEESAAQFRVLFESSPDAILLIDPQGNWPIVDCNAVACQMNGYSREELIGQSVDLLNLTQGTPVEREEYIKRLRESGVLKYETYHRRKDGSRIPIEVSTTFIQLGNRELLLGIDRDITVRRRFESDLQAANLQLTLGMRELEQRNTEAALLNALGEFLQSCEDVTEAYYVIRNISQKLFPDEVGALSIAAPSHNYLEVVAQWGDQKTTETVFAPANCWALRRGRVHQSHPNEGAPGCEHLSGLPDAAQLCVPLMAHGETFGVLSLCRQASAEPAVLEARQRLAQTVADSISLSLANLRLRDTLRNQSIRDSLTGLFNRRYMEETLDRELRRAARGNYPVGVMMIDIDHFKRFNDTYGHGSGDLLLAELGRFFTQHVRGSDIACRYGGEEFTLIMPEASLEDTRQKAQFLCDEFKAVRVQHDGQPLGAVSLSIGISAFPEHGSSGDTLVRAADAALYRAKRSGRARVVAAGE